MALSFEHCISCGGLTQVDPRVDPEDRRCMLCGGPCSETDGEDGMTIPSAETVVRDESYVPVELVASNCPHCEADIALDPEKPLSKQRCHSCGLLLQEPEKRKSRMRKRSQISPDGLLIKRSRERVWMPIAGIMLALVIGAIFTIWMMNRPETQAAPPEEVLPPDDRVAIRELIVRFTTARSPEELLPLIREPARFEKSLRAWCAAHPGALPLGGEILNIGSSRDAFGVTLRQAGVAWRDLPAGFLLVAGTPAGWQVDWRAFEGTGDLSLGDFLSQKPAAPVLLLGVARRSDYYNDAYADSKVWQCLHISDRVGENAFFAYVPRSDAAMMKALSVLPPGGRAGDLDPAAASRRLAIRIAFKNPESAALKQAEVRAVEGDGWYLP